MELLLFFFYRDINKYQNEFSIEKKKRLRSILEEKLDLKFIMIGSKLDSFSI